jgi:hypothetical protein
VGVALARIVPQDVAAEAVENLGLDPTAVDLLSPEALAASLRRTASVLCPAPPGAVVRAVADVLSDLPGFDSDARDDLEDLVTALVAYGDLLELPLDDAGTARRHLFLGPPAFVRRSTGLIVIGVRPDGAPLLGGELTVKLDYNRHLRVIPQDSSEEIAGALVDEGMIELTAEQWLHAPRACDARALIDDYARRLTARPPTADIEGVRLIASDTDVTYYRGRWTPPRGDDNGNFVARRPQAYGADLWSFVSIANGSVNRVLDLPVEDPLAPACDEAWRLQAAIDASENQPQRVRIRSAAQPDLALVDFFAPLPSWAQRRLDAVGLPVLRSPGALFSYQLPQAEVADETAALSDLLWIEPSDERGT